MDIKTLIPTPLGRPVSGRLTDTDSALPMATLATRLFEDMWGALGRAAWVTLPPQAIAKVDVTESSKELMVTAELPGLSDQDIEVTLSDDVLTIRAEKRLEGSPELGEKRDRLVAERSYGLFARSFRLPFVPEADQIEAEFQNGMLTVRVAKPQAVQDKVQKIAVRTADASKASTASSNDASATTDGKPAPGSMPRTESAGGGSVSH